MRCARIRKEKMMNRYTLGLTSTEMEIMEVMWEMEGGIPFKELLDWLNEKLDKQWKRQTLSTYLANLQKMGLVSSNGQHKNYIYYAACTREEHMQRQTRELVEKSYNNSLALFLSAFTGGQKLSQKEADSLKELLNEFIPNEGE